jgi:hypothetical protein
LLTHGTRGFSVFREGCTCLQLERDKRQMKGIMLRKSAFARAAMQGSRGYTIQRSGIVLPLGIDARRRIVVEPRWVTADGGNLGQLQRRMRMYHFASTRFSDAIGRLPSFEPSLLRKETVLFLPSLCSTKAMLLVLMLSVPRMAGVSCVLLTFLVKRDSASARYFLITLLVSFIMTIITTMTSASFAQRCIVQIKYMEGFDPNDWSDDPICTVVEVRTWHRYLAHGMTKTRMGAEDRGVNVALTRTETRTGRVPGPSTMYLLWFGIRSAPCHRSIKINGETKTGIAVFGPCKFSTDPAALHPHIFSRDARPPILSYLACTRRVSFTTRALWLRRRTPEAERMGNR